MPDLSRRQLLSAAAAAAAAHVGAAVVRAQEIAPAATAGGDSTSLHWLDRTPGRAHGQTFTMPWTRGTLDSAQPLAVEVDGNRVDSQSWPLAYWPDGSIKWTAHAALAGSNAKSFRIVRGEAPQAGPQIRITVSDQQIELDTGAIRCRIPRSGEHFIESILRGDGSILRNAMLVAMRQDSPETDSPGAITRQAFSSRIESAQVEQSGPIRAVIKITGVHESPDGRRWLPFVLRLYFFAGSDQFRLMHTFVFDGDEKKDFVCGLAVRFAVPLRDALHDRHIRLIGEEAGTFGEAVRPLTGLRRDPGEAARKAQVAGTPTPPSESWDQRVTTRLQYIPAWGDFTLTQWCADGFQIRKRTKPGHGWIAAGAGRRAAGVGYIGGAGGGVAFGMRDFWQKHPAQLDIRNAAGDEAAVTMWLWSPEAPPMDMRFYHDGLGMDTYPKQIEGLNITYEDYEDGYGTPYGIARTSEMHFWIAAATPPREELVKFADDVRRPPQLVCESQRYLDAGVFGALWSIEDRSTPFKAALEDELKFTLDRYINEIDQRSWYGFWDYGDVMHSYDADRHVWRYDIGGMAWDNSELSPDLWLWYSFLRGSRGDVYRLAEAMTRHTGEVDVYHIGRFKYLGTRHNVQHWGCSSKQTRISTAAYRRIFYYLTGDERVGDLLREQVNEGEAFKKIVVGRKLAADAPVLPLPPVESPPAGGKIGVGAMGWGSLMSAWMTEAERTGNRALHEKVITSMNGIAALPFGFYSGGWTIDLDSGAIDHDGGKDVGLSHLTNCFGLPETCAELVATYGQSVPKFAATWAQYGEIYNSTPEQREQALGRRLNGWSLTDSHSRCTAYAARLKNDRALAERAWRELLDGRPWRERLSSRSTKRVEGPDVLNPIDEAMLGTNGAAQWGLAAIQNLAVIGQWLPE